MTPEQIQAISNAMDKDRGRRQVICKYHHYGDNSEDFDWLRRKGYTVTNYPDFSYWVISW